MPDSCDEACAALLLPFAQNCMGINTNGVGHRRAQTSPFDGIIAQCQAAACRNVNCGSHGSCSAGTCQCDAGFSGSRCQTRDPCSGVTCSADGCCSDGTTAYACRDHLLDENGRNLCTAEIAAGSHEETYCPMSYGQIERDSTATPLHPNNLISEYCPVTCSTRASACECPVSGSSTCQTFDPCFGMDCGHGTCTNGRCVCSDGYSGSTCQHDACYGVTCSGHGSCEVSGSIHTCLCHGGYSGTVCQTRQTWRLDLSNYDNGNYRAGHPAALSCSSVCSTIGRTCTDGDWGVNDEASNRAVLLAAGEDPDELCDRWVDCSGWGDASVPRMNDDNGGVCYFQRGPTDCDSVGTLGDPTVGGVDGHNTFRRQLCLCD